MTYNHLHCWSRKENYVYWESDKPEYYEGEFSALMRFNLIYDGPLMATKASGGNRAEHKHAIRKQFHSQLKELWTVQTPFKEIYNHRIRITNAAAIGSPPFFKRLDEFANDDALENFRFVPTISERFGTACQLDVLFLRRQGPGELVGHGGDIDNRMKTLFDALQIPKELDEDVFPESHEDPFFVLAEDDGLITNVTLRTDRLLTPSKSSHPESDVRLVVAVEVQIVNVKAAYAFAEFGLL